MHPRTIPALGGLNLKVPMGFELGLGLSHPRAWKLIHVVQAQSSIWTSNAHFNHAH